MEVERASPPGFQGEILKPPEVKEEKEKVREEEVLKEQKGDVVRVNGVEDDEEEEEEEKEDKEEEEEEVAEVVEDGKTVVRNGNSIADAAGGEDILNGDDDDEGLHSDQIKKEEDVTCEEKVDPASVASDLPLTVEVKPEGLDESMDTSHEGEPVTEPPEDKGPKLEKAIFEEDLIDGFAFFSFETFPEVEVSRGLNTIIITISMPCHAMPWPS
jgi:hypothetical protein